MRLSYTRDIPNRLVFFAAALLFIIAYMNVMRETPGRTSASAEDAAPASSAAAALAAVDSGTRPRPFQGLLDSAVDGASLDALDSTRATDPYRTLMWNLKRYTVAEVSSLAETVSAADLEGAPALRRGCFVRTTGVLIKPLEMQRLPQNEAGYEDRWRGFLVDEDGNAFIFDLFEKPGEDFADRTEVVTVEGVFLQVVSYEARGGTKRVPFLEAKSLRAFKGERAGGLASSSMTLLLAAALVLVSIPFVAYMVSNFFARRHEADLVLALEKARQRRTAAKKNAAASPPGTTSPPAAAAQPTAPKPEASPAETTAPPPPSDTPATPPAQPPSPPSS